MLCRPYSARILHFVSDQMQNLPNYFTTPNKMTSENDIKGLVSLNFLRPCPHLRQCHMPGAKNVTQRESAPYPSAQRCTLFWPPIFVNTNYPTFLYNHPKKVGDLIVLRCLNTDFCKLFCLVNLYLLKTNMFQNYFGWLHRKFQVKKTYQNIDF